MTAISIQGLGRYFGAPVELDGTSPGEAWRTLQRILGFIPAVRSEDGVSSTVTVAGHVLRDISLEIDAGSIVCLTGASGAGKSVLLRILAGAIPPTSGRAEIRGTVSSLLGIGDNLDLSLTALENIEQYRALIQLPDDQVEAYAAEVIAFAELAGFERAALRTYSTGMRMRLSVAMALFGGASIMLIDDVLQVGDGAFQQKCIERVHALRDSGCTMVVAFSDPALVQRLATRVITLGGGRIARDSPPTHWLASRFGSRAAEVDWRISPELPEDDILALRAVTVTDRRDGASTHVDLELDVHAKTGGVRSRPSVFLLRDGTVVFRSLYPRSVEIAAAGRITFAVAVPTHLLANGEYTMTVSLSSTLGGETYSMKAVDVIMLTVRRDARTDENMVAAPLLAMTVPWEIGSIVPGRA